MTSKSPTSSTIPTNQPPRSDLVLDPRENDLVAVNFGTGGEGRQGANMLSRHLHGPARLTFSTPRFNIRLQHSLFVATLNAFSYGTHHFQQQTLGQIYLG
ncbi:hypothetical protein ONS95_014697 [Cadophora gregata]|uniref:uncharacterized protein n=1 Tax=Cadophora gregata TaxID=51156 RepID=UPI0026DBEF3F|nr:uncharacterized protein ONS95_014697 [Cadophora gregata]KAK0112983.1 hypothetical protein ONS95_014697 [Cadophora gregata]KAK0125106.1 hypothetical protein ONS96_008972 [Cadophora gregata f. sp. sojae]